MIHYTLLPEKEMKSLRAEYRIRILVVLMFFISCGIIIGICSLIPSYILSYSQEKELLQKIQITNKDNSNKDNDVFSKELIDSSRILNKLKSDQNSIIISDYIKKIINLKNNSIAINSIQISRQQDNISTLEMVLQGRADTRDSLIEFKKTLESSTDIIKVESPVSNLTKNKDVDFAFRIKFK